MSNLADFVVAQSDLEPSWSSSATTAESPDISSAVDLLGDAFRQGAGTSYEGRGWLMEIRPLLREIIGLSYNWDTYGALPPTDRAARRAVKVLRLLADRNAPRPDVVPTVDGGIELEWLRPNNITIQLTVEPDGRLSLFSRDYENNQLFEGSPSDPPERLTKLLWRYLYH